jgi:hypothetical protein
MRRASSCVATIACGPRASSDGVHAKVPREHVAVQRSAPASRTRTLARSSQVPEMEGVRFVDALPSAGLAIVGEMGGVASTVTETTALRALTGPLAGACVAASAYVPSASEVVVQRKVPAAHGASQSARSSPETETTVPSTHEPSTGTRRSRVRAPSRGARMLGASGVHTRPSPE